MLLGDPEPLEQLITGKALPAGTRRVSWSDSAAHFGENVLDYARRWQA